MREIRRYYIEITSRGIEAFGYARTGSSVVNFIRADAHTSLASLLKSVRKHWPKAKRLKRKPRHVDRTAHLLGRLF
jgi:hypothetical protein